MDHPCHPHPLQLNPSGAPYKCSGCKELGFGPSYRCENGNCGYTLHEECATAVPIAFHRFFKGSCFEFHMEPPGFRARYCDACGKDVLGFVYHCSKTGYDLHPCCLNLKDSVCDEREGNVTLKLCHKVPSKCTKCKSRNIVKVVRGWSYEYYNYDQNKYSCYHVSCVKELILENWKRGYFSSSQENNTISILHDSHQQLALTRSRRMGKIKKYSKIAVVVFKLIFSAIFGNPISAIAALVEALVPDID